MARPYKTGARRSHPSKIAAATPAHLHPKIKAALDAHAAGTAPLPDSVDHGPLWPSILDQNSTSACTAHAIACALYTSLAAQGKPLGFVPSPLCTYAMTRALERTQGAPLDPLPALTDSGAEIADVIAVLAQHGVRAMRAPSPGGYNSDVDPSNVLAEPDIQGAQEAALNLIAGPYTVDMTAGNLSDVLAAALASGMALDIAFECDDAFQALAAGQVAQAPVDAPDDGGHSTAITGYVPATAEQAAAIGVPVGTRLFWLTNSWGAGWSTGGRVLLAPSFVSAMYEAWPIAIAGGAS